MKKLIALGRLGLCSALPIIIFLSFFVCRDNAFAGSSKVVVCHYPPDDPTNAHTLFLPETAIQAHLRHGDVLGECPSGCLLNDSLCDDGNLCTSDTCLPDGGCEHVAVSCDDGDPCTLDSCDPAAGCLTAANDGAGCDDGNTCTDYDTCVGTVCIGQALLGCCAIDADCDDGDPCTVDSCADGTCTNAPKDCSGGDKCVVGYCEPSNGECYTTPVTCNDGNACTEDFCNSWIGCDSVPIKDPPQEICGNKVDDDCDGLTDYADTDDCPQVECPCWTAESIDEYARVLTRDYDHTVECNEYSDYYISIHDRKYDRTFDYNATVGTYATGGLLCELVDKDYSVEIHKNDYYDDFTMQQAVRCTEILRNSRMWQLNCTP